MASFIEDVRWIIGTGDPAGAGDYIGDQNLANEVATKEYGLFKKIKDIQKKAEDVNANSTTIKSDLYGVDINTPAATSVLGIVNTKHDDVVVKHGDIVVKHTDLVVKYTDFAGADGTGGKFADITPKLDQIDQNTVDGLANWNKLIEVSDDLVKDTDTDPNTFSKINKVSENIGKTVGSSEVITVGEDLQNLNSKIIAVEAELLDTAKIGSVYAELPDNKKIGTLYVDMLQVGTDPVGSPSTYSNVNNAYSNGVIATTQASSSSNSAIEALGYRDSAIVANTKAQEWATQADNVEVEAGKYSAMHWANVALTITRDDTIDDLSASINKSYSSSKTVELNDVIVASVANLTANEIALVPFEGLTSTDVQAGMLELQADVELRVKRETFKDKNTAYAMVDMDYIFADTSVAVFTMALPGSPVAGTQVSVLDVAGMFDQNNLTIERNGATIMGIADNMLLNIANSFTKFIYTGSDWRLQ